MSLISKPMLLDATGKRIADALEEIAEYMTDGTHAAKAVTAGVNFIDYDGTLLYAYTTEEALALTELPANPTREGLTSQGWNWSLEDIKSYLTDYPETIMTVGQMYITDDGKTRLHISVRDRLTIPLAFRESSDNGVVVDWGDQSLSETFARVDADGTVKATHTYTEEGEYTITLEVADGVTLSLGCFGRYDYYNVFGELVDINTGHDGLFSNCLTEVNIGAGIESIDSCVFMSMYDLKYITIPNGVDINEQTFYSCFSLTSITLPNGVSSISTRAFFGCINLQTISIPVLPENASIGVSAFESCYCLQAINIPYGLTLINENAFSLCSGLTSVTIPNGVEIGDNAFTDNTRLKDLILGENIIVDNYAFSYCTSIKQVSLLLESEVDIINQGIFCCCYSLREIELQDGIETIDEYAFNNCISLKRFTIPSSVITINQDAFSWCMSLKTVIIWAETPPTLSDEYVFASIPEDCAIYVPYGTLSTYRNYTNWSAYYSHFVEMPEGAEPGDDIAPIEVIK